ncbi:carboxypeptidase regulatory-like domain-containing protein [Acidobacteria bacterium AB60]|nr:carboxypeptidase regulatory-like domain-containing protein [Acidobacteria bacterium AB60]
MKVGARLAAGMMFAVLAFGVFPGFDRLTPAGHAQNLGQRAVNGTVVDADSAPVLGATVFLRNSKSKSIRSYTSTKDGRFRFVQVNMSEDYDLWAEKDGKKSPVKTVSSWDTRKEVEMELKLK